MEIYQAVDSFRSANLIVVFFAEPGKFLLQQHQYAFNKCLLTAISLCHAVLLKRFKDWKMGQLKRH